MYNIILFLYTDNIDLEGLTVSLLIGILKECDKLVINNLLKVILEYLNSLIRTLP